MIASSLFRRHPALRALAAGTALAGVLTACTPTIDVRGNMPDPEVLSGIRPGVQNREAVTEMLGSPSTVAVFDKETWYYIGRKTETSAFFEPEVLEQKVVMIKFDENGMVESVTQFGPDDAHEIALVERTTPTKGKELTFLQQLVGNLGRYSASSDDP